jgi:hypothetical protein
MIFMDAVKELYLHYERVKTKITEYESKQTLDNRQLSAYLQWIALAGNLCEKIWLLENKDKFHGFDCERNNRMRQYAFGDWVNKVDAENESKMKGSKEFRVK